MNLFHSNTSQKELTSKEIICSLFLNIFSLISLFYFLKKWIKSHHNKNNIDKIVKKTELSKNIQDNIKKSYKINDETEKYAKIYEKINQPLRKP